MENEIHQLFSYFAKELESQENPISTIVKNSIDYNIKNINKNNNIIIY